MSPTPNDTKKPSEIQIVELRLRKHFSRELAVVRQESAAAAAETRKECLDLFRKIETSLQPIIDIYKNAGTFSKWIKAALIFLVLLGSFAITFKGLLGSLLNKL